MFAPSGAKLVWKFVSGRSVLFSSFDPFALDATFFNWCFCGSRYCVRNCGGVGQCLVCTFCSGMCDSAYISGFELLVSIMFLSRDSTFFTELRSIK